MGNPASVATQYPFVFGIRDQAAPCIANRAKTMGTFAGAYVESKAFQNLTEG